MQTTRILLKLQRVSKGLPEAWRWSLIVLVVDRIILSLWAGVIWKLGLVPCELCIKYYWGIQPIINGWKGALLGVWQRWDTIYYMRIAQSGYNAIDLSAFFPFYPILGRFLSLITKNESLVSLLVISNIAFLLSMVLLYQHIEETFSSEIAKRTLIFLSIFPTSFFFLTPYPHSLSLLLVISAYLSARQSKWALTFIFGFFAGLTHSTVLPLVLALGYETYKHWQQSNSKGRWVILITPFGPALGTFLFFAWRLSAGFPPLTILLEESWGRVVQAPWLTLIDIIRMSKSHTLIFTTWLNLLLLIIVIFVTFWEVKYLNSSLNIYMFSSVIYLLFFTTVDVPLASLGRYILLMFPLFIGLALWAHTKHRRMISYSFGMASQLFLLGLFVMWAWVG